MLDLLPSGTRKLLKTFKKCERQWYLNTQNTCNRKMFEFRSDEFDIESKIPNSEEYAKRKVLSQMAKLKAQTHETNG